MEIISDHNNSYDEENSERKSHEGELKLKQRRMGVGISGAKCSV